MQKLFGRRPSTAMVVAVLALSLSLVGTGVAATISVLSKQERKQVKKISRQTANKRITARAGNLSVATADNALRLGGIDASGYQAASNFTETEADFPLTLTHQTIGSPIQVTTTGTKRVIATASVTAFSADADSVVCRVSVDGTVGLEYWQFMPDVGQSTPGSVSPAVSAVVPAGAHAVTLQCRTQFGGNTAVTQSSLAAWAVSG